MRSASRRRCGFICFPGLERVALTSDPVLSLTSRRVSGSLTMRFSGHMGPDRHVPHAHSEVFRDTLRTFRTHRDVRNSNKAGLVVMNGRSHINLCLLLSSPLPHLLSSSSSSSSSSYSHPHSSQSFSSDISVRGSSQVTSQSVTSHSSLTSLYSQFYSFDNSLWLILRSQQTRLLQTLRILRSDHGLVFGRRRSVELERRSGRSSALPLSRSVATDH